MAGELFFAVPPATLIVSRLAVETPLPEALQPALLILVAPFAVGFSAYVTVTGRVDLFAEALFCLSVFVLAVLLGRLRHVLACCPFRTTWWAVSFPLSATAVAALRFAGAEGDVAADGVAIVLLALATTVIPLLVGRTAVGVVRGELRALVG